MERVTCLGGWDPPPVFRTHATGRVVEADGHHVMISLIGLWHRQVGGDVNRRRPDTSHSND